MAADTSPRRAAPLVLSAALFMETLDSAILATALPSIAADIATSPIALKLALTSYYVALAAFIPVSGRLADRFGPGRVFRLAIAVFMLGSLACAAAESLGGFVAARFLQGMGGAMMTPVARLLLVRATPKAGLVAAMAWFTIPAMVGPLIGPPLGGAIAQHLDWRWIFWVNLPIGLAGIVAAWRALPQSAADPSVRFDWRGLALSATACSGVVFGASVVSLPALPPWVGVSMLSAGALAALAYLRHARRRADPILRLSLFAVPSFAASMNALFLFRLGVGALPFLTPLMLQLGFGFTPLASGLISCAAIGGALGMKFLARAALARFGFRLTLTATALAGGLMAAPMGLWRPEAPLALLLALLLGGGFARSLFFTSANALAYADLDQQRVGDATALMAVGQQLAIALGVAFAGAVLEALMACRGAAVPAPFDFTLAFAAAGVACAAAALVTLRLAPDAGADVSGARVLAPALATRSGTRPAE